METDNTIEIVQRLADGVDPFTGERFPSGSPYQYANKSLHPALSPEHGWVMPVNTNAFRTIQLRTDVGLPGIHVLTLSGSGVRVWQSPHPATGDTPLLVAGQTVTKGVAGVSWNTGSIDHVYIQSIAPGTATLTYTFTGTGTASGIVSRASLKMTAFSINIDGTTIEMGFQWSIRG